jgi:glycosyltransferase involved in cell wall biosynthesis
MTDDLVSVVIPCFNASRYIAAALRSVQEQHWTPLEIIVVDDGSTDGSPELIASAFPEVRLIRQANQGAAVARNRGVREARGTWVAFLDADDVWLPGKLAAQADKLLADPGARLVYTAWQVWPGEAPSPGAAELAALLEGADEPSRWEGPSGWIYPELLLDCALWTSTVMVHRSVFDEVGVFDTGLRIGEDYDLWLRISRATRILRVDRPFALYRAHAASITRTAPLENYRAIVVSRAIARWGYGHEPAGTASRARVRRALARSWSDYAASNLAAAQFDRAGRGAWMSLRTDPTHALAWKVLIKTAVGTFMPAFAREPS